jgi:hypothetical protein
MRSEQSDEQSAEQLQEVDHSGARVAHRCIRASPDAIFGSHSTPPGTKCATLSDGRRLMTLNLDDLFSKCEPAHTSRPIP